MHESFKLMNIFQKNTLTTTDKTNASITITWFKTNLCEQPFADAMRVLWPLAHKAYLPVEMDFLKAHPTVVGQEPSLNAFEPLFAHGPSNVDWAAAEALMTKQLERLFVFDPANFSPAIIAHFAQDSAFVVTATDSQTNLQLGLISFMVRISYPANTVKVMSFAVAADHQNRGIGKLLMSSVFAFLPDTTTLFLHTRVTNQNAIRAYRNWGFVDDHNPIMDHQFNLAHWIFLTYDASTTSKLQTVIK